MGLRIRFTVLPLVLALAAVSFLACGSSDEPIQEVPVERVVAGEAVAPAPAAPFLQPTPVPPTPPVPSQATAAPGAVDPAAVANGSSDAAAAANGSSDNGEVATLVRQRRIVVRTVDMGLVVSGIQASMDGVAAVAHGMGGWIVSSERSNDFSGSIAVRVPAERLDEAIARIRDIAVAVESEISTSKDVTAEYYDSESRLRNMRATETAMLSLLERAPNARDALEIRKTLSEVQEEIEVLLGRLKLLEETSAFSLIKVYMRVAQVDLRVDAGPDRTVSIGQTVRFKANFQSPDGSSAYNVVWDFGDRSETLVDAFTASTTQPGVRVTASVTHLFDDYRDSPYFVDVRIYGASESSPLFGQDTIKVTVLDTDQMPVDAGEDQTTAVGRSIRFRAFFEPPEGIDQFNYTWDFGDGTATVTGGRAILTEDSRRMVTAVTNHTYHSAAESPYIVQIKMVGTGEAGVVEGSDKAVVTVTELPVMIVSAGEAIRIEEGTNAKLRGTFNRPSGVTNMRYRWDFGDGSGVDEGDLDEESAAVEVEHQYIHEGRYVATLTVTGESEVGDDVASSRVDVRVVEGRGWVVGGYNIQGNTKEAVRLLSEVFKGLVTVTIWVAVLSPLWGGSLAALFLLNRLFLRWRRVPSPPQRPRPRTEPESQGSLDEQESPDPDRSPTP